jgi:hypothetical protein
MPSTASPSSPCGSAVATESGAPPAHWQCIGCRGWYPDGSSCEVCVTCDHCGTTIPAQQTTSTARGSTICGACREDWYR